MGVNPIEPDCNDILSIKKEYGNDIVLMGNFDIGGLLSQPYPDNVCQGTHKKTTEKNETKRWLYCNVIQ